MFFGPCGVPTSAMPTGAVNVESTISVGGVESCMLQSTPSLETLFLVSLVSARFHPERS